MAVGSALEKIQRQKPTWQDYVDEGVIDRVPEPGPDGKFEMKVNGHDKVVRMLQMNEKAYEAQAWQADNRAAKRTDMHDARAERKSRKHFKPSIRSVVGAGMTGTQYRCEFGHLFRFLPRDDRARTMKCVHDGCNGTGVLERA